MSEEAGDFDMLDEKLDEVFSKKIGEKGETLTDEMIDILRKRACQWKPKRQEGGISPQLLMVGLAFAVTALGAHLSPIQEKFMDDKRVAVRGSIDPENINAARYVDLQNTVQRNPDAPVNEKWADVQGQVDLLNNRFNRPIHLLENIYDNATPDNVAFVAGSGAVAAVGVGAIVGAPVMAAGGVVAGGAAGIMGIYKAVVAGVAAKEGANIINEAAGAVKDGVNNIKQNISPGVKEIKEYKGKVLPLIKLIKESPYEFRNIEKFENFNKLDRLKFDGLNTQQEGNVKKLITLAYLHKSVDSYIKYITFILDNLDATFDEAPANLSLEEAKVKLHKLKENLHTLQNDLPGKKLDMYNVHDKVMSIIDGDEFERIESGDIDNPYKQNEKINIKADNTQIKDIQNMLDDPSIKEIIAPDGIQQVQQFFNNQLYTPQGVINNIYNNMIKIGQEAQELEGERSYMYEAIASGALALSGIYIVFPSLYRFFFPEKKGKTGGKKTKNKRKKHNNKSKKIRPRKTTNKRVKKNKSKRKHK